MGDLDNSSEAGFFCPVYEMTYCQVSDSQFYQIWPKHENLSPRRFSKGIFEYFRIGGGGGIRFKNHLKVVFVSFR